MLAPLLALHFGHHGDALFAPFQEDLLTSCLQLSATSLTSGCCLSQGLTIWASHHGVTEPGKDINVWLQVVSCCWQRLGSCVLVQLPLLPLVPASSCFLPQILILIISYTKCSLETKFWAYFSISLYFSP